MRVSSRPKVSVSISLAFFLVCAFSLYGFVGSTNTAYAASATRATRTTTATTSFKGTLSSAQRVGTVNPAALAKSSGHATYKVMPMRGRPAGGNASPAIGGRPDWSGEEGDVMQPGRANGQGNQQSGQPQQPGQSFPTQLPRASSP